MPSNNSESCHSSSHAGLTDVVLTTSLMVATTHSDRMENRPPGCVTFQSNSLHTRYSYNNNVVERRNFLNYRCLVIASSRFTATVPQIRHYSLLGQAGLTARYSSPHKAARSLPCVVLDIRGTSPPPPQAISSYSSRRPPAHTCRRYHRPIRHGDLSVACTPAGEPLQPGPGARSHSSVFVT